MLTTRWLLLSLPLLAACDAGPTPPVASGPREIEEQTGDPAPVGPPPAERHPEAAPFTGRFEGEEFVLELDPALRGTLTIGRRGPFPAEAKVTAGALQGRFVAEGRRYPFSARSEGDTLLLTADRHEFRLRRASASARKTSHVLPGTYQGSLNGLPATLTLRARGEALEGEATTSDGYRYTVQAERTPDGARGSFGDPQSGRTLPLRLASSAAGVELTVSAPGKPPAKVVFEPTPAAPAEPSPPARDPDLVGTWIQGGRDGGLERATLQLKPDGTYLYGTSRAHDESSGARSEAGQGQVIQGIWRTEGGVLYTRPAGQGSWIRYAGYAQADSRLELTFEGERAESWLRKG